MRKLFFITICVSFLGVGCTTTKPMYHYGKYSHSLYAYKKSPSDETFATHMESIDNCIKQSMEKETRVPPGIYAEYGYMLMQQNEYEGAIKYFLLEKSTYPESALFMDKLINEAKKSLEKEG